MEEKMSVIMQLVIAGILAAIIMFFVYVFKIVKMFLLLRMVFAKGWINIKFVIDKVAERMKIKKIEVCKAVFIEKNNGIIVTRVSKDSTELAESIKCFVENKLPKDAQELFFYAVDTIVQAHVHLEKEGKNIFFPESDIQNVAEKISVFAATCYLYENVKNKIDIINDEIMNNIILSANKLEKEIAEKFIVYISIKFAEKGVMNSISVEHMEARLYHGRINRQEKHQEESEELVTSPVKI